jgi:hypothetical protein
VVKEEVDEVDVEVVEGAVEVEEEEVVDWFVAVESSFFSLFSFS